jgi:hypothetical protein
VSGGPLAIAFFDPARDLHGTARAGATLLFEGRQPTAIGEGPEIEVAGTELRAVLPGRFALELEPVSEAADLEDVSVRICRVRGDVGGRRVECLGTVSETRRTPEWDELELLRTVTAIADEENAFLAIARRPRGADGHGDERATGVLLEDGKPHKVDDTRISTVYDGGGRQRSAGLELWVRGEDYPHRGSGAAVAGSSLDLTGLSVHVAMFRWRLDGREAVGAYELMLRAQPREAA